MISWVPSTYAYMKKKVFQSAKGKCWLPVTPGHRPLTGPQPWDRYGLERGLLWVERLFALSLFQMPLNRKECQIGNSLLLGELYSGGSTKLTITTAGIWRCISHYNKEVQFLQTACLTWGNEKGAKWDLALRIRCAYGAVVVCAILWVLSSTVSETLSCSVVEISLSTFVSEVPACSSSCWPSCVPSATSSSANKHRKNNRIIRLVIKLSS